MIDRKICDSVNYTIGNNLSLKLDMRAIFSKQKAVWRNKTLNLSEKAFIVSQFFVIAV